MYRSGDTHPSQQLGQPIPKEDESLSLVAQIPDLSKFDVDTFLECLVGEVGTGYVGIFPNSSGGSSPLRPTLVNTI